MNKIAGLIAALIIGLATAAVADKPAAPPPATPPAAAPKDGAKKDEKIDINSATVDALKALPGIGDARAADIVKGRPYDKKDQLVSRKILTQKVYDGIKDLIIAKQPSKGAPPPATPPSKG